MTWWHELAEPTWWETLLAFYLYGLWLLAFLVSALFTGYMVVELMRAFFRHIHGVRDGLD